MPFVYGFDHRHRKAPASLKALLGGKGANLAEMTSRLKLPVPPGFTITTEACRAYLADGWPEGLDDEIDRYLGRVEDALGRRLGDPDDPLLVSVRSGAAQSMPGMMDTVLNLGLGDVSVESLAAQTGDPHFAYDSYRRFIALYAKVVLGLPGEEFDRLLDSARDWDGARTDAEVSYETLHGLCERYLEIVERATGSPFPQDPRAQLRGAIEAVFRSWNGARARAYRDRERIPHDGGTAVNVQAMVFGNRDDDSGTGVGFTRNPANGDPAPYGDFLVNAQGEDVVAGIRATETLDDLQRRFPDIHAELLRIFDRLEGHYRDMCDTEFTIEQGKLWMLQTRVGKRTGAAALRMAIDMHDEHPPGGRHEEALSVREALQRITAEHVDQLLHPEFAEPLAKLDVLATGLPASPGAGVGRVYFTADDAVAASERGEKVILVRNETSPEDVHGMQVAEAILTARGGLVSHAAVVARGWGIPAVVGAETLHIEGRHLRVGDVIVDQGDELSVSGTDGAVVRGAVPLTSLEHSDDLMTMLEWAEDVCRGVVSIRANADTRAEAEQAREFGAEGIGLARTEHMFFGDDRLPVMRRMILAGGGEEEAAALEELRRVQRDDFVGILEAMDGLPVTVRLLDPPLHEFLPPLDDLLARQACGDLDEEERALLEVALDWREVNPMIGTRGVRLGMVKPGLYAMQVRALLDAVADRVAAGGRPVVEVMIPLTVTRAELAEARRWVEEAIEESEASGSDHVDITIGTMIETPRAALRADDLAEAADFFSFGTNDLTQLTFGFSRDDVESRVMPTYLAKGLLARNPFESVDPGGVGELVRLGIERGRGSKPGLKVGVCGEHGGDPDSISLFLDAGVDYVSCSPFRVPIARVSAAQAIIRREG
jgi:pyruvate, orthophosphate dikinase